MLNKASCHTDVWRSGGIAAINLGTRWGRVVSLALQSLYPQGRTPVPDNQEDEWIP
jgi:hypothetical protein